MLIAVSILFSALFLGCVFLYIKDEQKNRWRKTLVLISGVSVALLLVILLSFIIQNQFDKNSYGSRFLSDSTKLPTHLNGVKLGDILSNLQFKHGELRESKVDIPIDISELNLGSEKEWNYKRYFLDDENITVLTKGQEADILSYACPRILSLEGTKMHSRHQDTRLHHQVKCGDSTQEVFKAYGRENVGVFCAPKDVRWRLYEIKKKNIRLFLIEDGVQSIMFSSKPFPPSKYFTYEC